ncbi:MAG: universal stress protein [Thermoleophilia bacterium]|nr:universal stress protein [Thermoleophilia bacterium]
MYKKMVVLLDGSELAEVVFEYAQELSGRVHMDLELLHVCDPKEADELPMRRGYIERMAQDLCAKAEAVRAKYRSEPAETCIQASGHVVVGSPVTEILKYIDENDIDLVLMSTHGSSGDKEWDLGDVANKVIHASRVPIWLVPVELREEIIADTLPGRSMVVPLSGTKQSGSAIPHAVYLMKQRAGSGEIILLHVMEPGYIHVSRAALEAADEKREQMKTYLEGVANEIREAGLTVRTEVLTGEPADGIINYLKRNPAQLLVMATRGHSRLSRMVFGSVTESVIHLVKRTPLLLVSGED